MQTNSHMAWMVAIFIGVTLTTTPMIRAESKQADVVAELSTARIFKRPIKWAGEKSPDIEQAWSLYQAVGLDETQKPGDVIAAVEEFIQTHPDSGWTPSLRANLAVYYRSLGRYSKALEHWKLAWEATKTKSDTGSRYVAEFTAAYWTQLLSSLGRVEELKQLTSALAGSTSSDPEFQKMIAAARQSADAMKRQPAISYRCGTMALYYVARELGVKKDCQGLVDMNSPETGFSLARLTELAKDYQMGLVAVQRTEGAEIVVPSVVHWKENHYAAIVEKANGSFRVIDPTF